MMMILTVHHLAKMHVCNWPPIPRSEKERVKVCVCVCVVVVVVVVVGE